MTALWTIEPLHLHRCLVPGPEVFFHADFDRRVEIAIYAFVLTSSAGTRVLVDTGLPADHAALNAAVRRRKGAWSGFTDAGPRLAGILAERKLTSDAVVLTSFGPYAAGGLPEIAAPRVFVSARGIRDLDSPEIALFAHPPGPDVAAALRAHTDAVDGRTAPWAGLSVHETGIHHPASMTVIVETAAGRVAIADPVFLAENLTRGIPLGVAEYAAHWVAEVAALAGQVDAILPIHDPSPQPVPVAAIDARLRAGGIPAQGRVKW